MYVFVCMMEISHYCYNNKIIKKSITDFSEAETQFNIFMFIFLDFQYSTA